MPRRRDCACDCDAVRCAVTNDALCERASPLSPHDNGTDVRTERRQPQAERRRDASPAAVAARIARFDAFAQRIAVAPINDPRPVSEIVDDINAL